MLIDEIPWPDVAGAGDVGVIWAWMAASRQGHALADHLAEHDLMEIWNPRGAVPRRGNRGGLTND
jgi:hypothetical protein